MTLPIEITITDALKALGQTNFVCSGDPTTQAEFEQMFAPISGEDEHGSAILETDPSEWSVTWTQVKAKYDELVAAHPISLLREARDKKLAVTDWIVTKSLESGVAVPGNWQTYRQALRDITETYTSLDDVIWPEKPQ